MRLVGADHFHDKIDWEDEGEVYFLEQYLFDEPTVDAVPVVRCKDCKYSGPTTINSDVEIFCRYSRAYFFEDSFCSFGERKDFVNEDKIQKDKN